MLALLDGCGLLGLVRMEARRAGVGSFEPRCPCVRFRLIAAKRGPLSRSSTVSHLASHFAPLLGVFVCFVPLPSRLRIHDFTGPSTGLSVYEDPSRWFSCCLWLRLFQAPLRLCARQSLANRGPGHPSRVRAWIPRTGSPALRHVLWVMLLRCWGGTSLSLGRNAPFLSAASLTRIARHCESRKASRAKRVLTGGRLRVSHPSVGVEHAGKTKPPICLVFFWEPFLSVRTCGSW